MSPGLLESSMHHRCMIDAFSFPYGDQGRPLRHLVMIASNDQADIWSSWVVFLSAVLLVTFLGGIAWVQKKVQIEQERKKPLTRWRDDSTTTNE